MGIFFVTGIRINFSPFEIRLISSFVSSLLERFFMCFLLASECSWSCFLCLVCFRSLRFVLDKLALCGFRFTLPEVFESESRHVYFSTCLSVMPCSVDITFVKLSNLSCLLSASFCTFSSVTLRLLAADFSFHTFFPLFTCTSVLKCFVEDFGLFPRLITTLEQLISR